jgi:hypothetical protein
MELRKITPEEIDYLFRIIEQNGVKYYDVQMELVDHFASAVEKRWESYPNATFSEAFVWEYKKLKDLDFELIQTEKENALRIKYRRIEFTYIKDFFTWPKIFATVFTTFTIYLLFSLFFNYLRFVSWIVLTDYLLVGLFSYLVYPQKFNIKLKESKEFLLLEHLKSRKYYFMQVGRLPSILLMCIIFFNKDYHFTFIENPAFKIFVAFLVSMSVVYFIATGIYVPQRVKADFTREFPQFVKS